ncbi:unnamed protein product [Strongylus vulgaris]|uniref:Uncharacterized protein n=1 Tax=Strongylus vulgaris TaxID=40348 RepID=A0A3P7IJR6_STRVU|nr:unnamed protein product [Strongylus vulgaris]
MAPPASSWRGGDSGCRTANYSRAKSGHARHPHPLLIQSLGGCSGESLASPDCTGRHGFSERTRQPLAIEIVSCSAPTKSLPTPIFTPFSKLQGASTITLSYVGDVGSVDPSVVHLVEAHEISSPRLAILDSVVYTEPSLSSTAILRGFSASYEDLEEVIRKEKSSCKFAVELNKRRKAAWAAFGPLKEDSPTDGSSAPSPPVRFNRSICALLAAKTWPKTWATSKALPATHRALERVF